jgi:hypothetical protein
MNIENFANQSPPLEALSGLTSELFQHGGRELTFNGPGLSVAKETAQQTLEHSFGSPSLVDGSLVADASQHYDKVTKPDPNHTEYYLAGWRIHETAKGNGSTTETNFSGGRPESSQTTHRDGTVATTFYGIQGPEYQVVDTKGGTLVYEYNNQFNPSTGNMERVPELVTDQDQKQELIEKARSTDFHPPRPFPGSG